MDFQVRYICMYVTSDYNTQLSSLAWLFGFVALSKALSIDWTRCVWSHEDYEDQRFFMGDNDYCIIGWGIGQPHK